MEGIIQRISDESPDPEVKKLCRLLRLALQINPETLALNTQQSLNRLLAEQGYNQNNMTRNNRRVKLNEFSSLVLFVVPQLRDLASQVSPELLYTILSYGIPSFASTKGDKEFNYRLVKFQRLIELFLTIVSQFTDAEVQLLIQRLPNTEFLLTYNKDWQTLFPPANRNFPGYAKIIEEYKATERPFIQLLVAFYNADAEISVEEARTRLRNRIKTILSRTAVNDIVFLKLIFSKFLPDTDELFAPLMPNVAMFKNIWQNDCPETEVRSVTCPSGAVIRLCPASADDSDIVEAVCAQQGGKRTRKRARKSKCKATRVRRT
jgi:hypothetical protein